MSGVLVTSDLHAHPWTRFATTLPNGRNSRFEHLLQVLEQISGIASAFNVHTILVLGDLTHQRYYMRFSVYTPLMEWLVSQRRDWDRRVIVLKGNHDEETETTHSLGPLAFAGIDVVDSPRFIDVAELGTSFFVPYMDGHKIVEALGHVSHYHGAGSQAFLHYALDGKVMTGGEYALSSPLHLSDLDGFDRVVLGHVHAPAIEQRGRVIYVGAPLHFDFGDSGDRFCWIFGNGQEPVPIKLFAPKFVTTAYPRIGTAPEHSGFLRVLATPPSLFEDVKREARAQGWLDCLPIEVRMPDEATRVLSQAVMVDEHVIRAWVERQYPDVAEPDREVIVTFGLECLREAQR